MEINTTIISGGRNVYPDGKSIERNIEKNSDNSGASIQIYDPDFKVSDEKKMKLAQLKESIEGGTYNIDIDAITEKLSKDLI